MDSQALRGEELWQLMKECILGSFQEPEAVKIVKYRDVDYETAKKEVAGYFQMKGEAYASDASTDLQLNYDLVCKIMDDLEKEGKMEPVQ